MILQIPLKTTKIVNLIQSPFNQQSIDDIKKKVKKNISNQRLLIRFFLGIILYLG